MQPWKGRGVGEGGERGVYRHAACTWPQDKSAEVAFGISLRTNKSQSVEHGVVGLPPVRRLHGGRMMT